MKSVLEEFYKDIGRPISQNELAVLNKKNMKNLKLSNIETYHTKSGYFYSLKKNGKKETDAQKIIDQYNLPTNTVKNVGMCSVTWKLDHTPHELYDAALNVVNEYTRRFKNLPLSEHEKALCQALGKRLATIALKLSA